MADDGDLPHRYFTALERGLTSLNGLVRAVGVGVLVAVIVLNFNAIAAGVHGLAEKLPHILKFNALGVNVELDRASIEASVKGAPTASTWLKDNWSDNNTKNAFDGLKTLDKRELERLMRLGDGGFSVVRCKKENAQTLYEHAVDKSLEEKGLVTLKELPGCAPAGDCGPAQCYEMKATGAGHDVQTAVISSIGAPPAPAAASAPNAANSK